MVLSNAAHELILCLVAMLTIITRNNIMQLSLLLRSFEGITEKSNFKQSSTYKFLIMNNITKYGWNDLEELSTKIESAFTVSLDHRCFLDTNIIYSVLSYCIYRYRLVWSGIA